MHRRSTSELEIRVVVGEVALPSHAGEKVFHTQSRAVPSDMPHAAVLFVSRRMGPMQYETGWEESLVAEWLPVIARREWRLRLLSGVIMALPTPHRVPYHTENGG